jgi:hypothetical protein
MAMLDLILGRPLASEEDKDERVGRWLEFLYSGLTH